FNGTGNTAFNGSLTIAGGTLAFNRSGGTINVSPGVMVTVNAGATFNISGANLLSNGGNTASVVNNSTSTFNVTGGSQILLNLDGAGNTTVANGATLTVNHVQQNALTVNGTVNDRASGGDSGTSYLNSLSIGGSGALDANLGTTPAPGIAILSGDADFDGQVTPGDYGILDANLGQGSSNPLNPDPASAGTSAVPEPASATFVLFAGSILAARRRRR